MEGHLVEGGVVCTALVHLQADRVIERRVGTCLSYQPEREVLPQVTGVLIFGDEGGLAHAVTGTRTLRMAEFIAFVKAQGVGFLFQRGGGVAAHFDVDVVVEFTVVIDGTARAACCRTLQIHGGLVDRIDEKVDHRQRIERLGGRGDIAVILRFIVLQNPGGLARHLSGRRAGLDGIAKHALLVNRRGARDAPRRRGAVIGNLAHGDTLFCGVHILVEERDGGRGRINRRREGDGCAGSGMPRCMGSALDTRALQDRFRRIGLARRGIGVDRNACAVSIASDHHIRGHAEL